jgi:hypothetical protein
MEEYAFLLKSENNSLKELDPQSNQQKLRQQNSLWLM